MLPAHRSVGKSRKGQEFPHAVSGWGFGEGEDELSAVADQGGCAASDSQSGARAPHSKLNAVLPGTGTARAVAGCVQSRFAAGELPWAAFRETFRPVEH